MPSYTLYYFNGRGRAEAIRMMFNVAGVQFTDKRIEFNEWDKFRNEMPTYCMPVLEIDGKNNRMPQTMAICRYLAREFGFYGKTNMEMFRNDYICDSIYEIMHDYMRYFHEKNGRFRCNMGSNMIGSGMGTNMGTNKASNMVPNMKGDMSSNRSNSMSSTTSSLGSSVNKDMSTTMSSNVASNMASSQQTGSAMGFDGSYMKMKFQETCRRVLPFLERTLNMHCGGNKFFMGEQLMMCDMVLFCFLENPMMEFQQIFNAYPKLMSMCKRVATHPKVSAYLQKRVKSTW